MKRHLRKIISIFLTRRAAITLFFLGPKRAFIYFVAQRVLRINSHVPWPVHWSSVVTAPENIKTVDVLPFLGHHPGCYIQAMNGIIVGKNVRYGPGVHFISANHDLLDYDKHSFTPPIIIGNNCWIGAGAILLPGVELGEHVVVAAGAVVTKSVGANQLVGGVPARVIADLDEYAGSPNWGWRG